MCVPCRAWVNGPVQADHIIVRLREVLQTIVAILCKHNLGQGGSGKGSESDSYQQEKLACHIFGPLTPSVDGITLRYFMKGLLFCVCVCVLGLGGMA